MGKRTTQPGPAALGIIGVNEVATMLGISAATVRQHVAARTPWMPQPDRVSGVALWARAQFDDIEERRRRPGARTAPAVATTPTVAPTTAQPPSSDGEGWWG